MSGEDGQRVAIYAAAGYTGRQVAREVALRGYVPVLVGRDGEKLRPVASELNQADIRVAAVDDPAALLAALEGSAAVINCAGPFAATAEPIARAAIEAGAHYVDVTAEQSVVENLTIRLDEPAGRAGVALVPAMGFYGALGDVGAALAAEGLTAVEEIAIAYAVDGWRLTRASRATAPEMSRRRVAWREGALEDVSDEVGFGEFSYPEPLGTSSVMEDYPLPEALTVPRHVSTPRVRLMMAAATLQEIMAPDAPAPEDVSDQERAATSFTVVVDAIGDQGERRVIARGKDIYGISAPMAVAALAALDEAAGALRGCLSAAQVVDPRSFLNQLEPRGLVTEVGAKGSAGAARK